jgi:hypothetical protein
MQQQVPPAHEASQGPAPAQQQQQQQVTMRRVPRLVQLVQCVAVGVPHLLQGLAPQQTDLPAQQHHMLGLAMRLLGRLAQLVLVRQVPEQVAGVAARELAVESPAAEGAALVPARRD